MDHIIQHARAPIELNDPQDRINFHNMITFYLPDLVKIYITGVLPHDLEFTTISIRKMIKEKILVHKGIKIILTPETLKVVRIAIGYRV